MTRQQILTALSAFAESRPGMEPRNYFSDWRDKAGIAAYRSESRAVTRDLHDARDLLRYVELRESIEITPDAFRAFSGRLTLTTGPLPALAPKLDYCAGQYFPTEYRRAVCAVLASAIWAWLRDNRGDCCTGDDIRKGARRELGASLARRWFN